MKNRQRNPSLGHPNMRCRSFQPRRFSSLRCFHLWTAKKVMIGSACDCGQTSMLVVIECIAVSYPKHLARKLSFWTCLLQRFHTDKASQVASENSKDLRFLKHVKLLLQFLAKQHLRLKGATETSASAKQANMFRSKVHEQGNSCPSAGQCGDFDMLLQASLNPIHVAFSWTPSVGMAWLVSWIVRWIKFIKPWNIEDHWSMLTWQSSHHQCLTAWLKLRNFRPLPSSALLGSPRPRHCMHWVWPGHVPGRHACHALWLEPCVYYFSYSHVTYIPCISIPVLYRTA